MSNLTTYVNYFRQLAVSHKDIRHEPASETGDAAPGSQRFTKVDDYIQSLGGKIGFPLLALELYDLQTQSEASPDVKLKTQGGFSIIDNPVDQSHAAKLACFVKSETIVLDILKKIYQDHFTPLVDECEAPFKDFDFNKVEMTPISNVFSGQHGYRVLFGFEFQKTIDITEAPAAGTFL